MFRNPTVLQTVKRGSIADLYNYGRHLNSRPDPVRPDLSSMRKFQEIVGITPEVTPKQLRMGPVNRNPMMPSKVTKAEWAESNHEKAPALVPSRVLVKIEGAGSSYCSNLEDRM